MRWLISVLVFCLTALPASAAAVLSVQALSTPGTVSAIVEISGVTDLYAWQFDLTFDPGVLQVQSQTEGDFLSSVGSTFFLDGSVDNSSGVIANTAAALEGFVPGVDGSGTLLQIAFVSSGFGSSGLSLSNVILLNSLGDDIAYTTVDSTVNVVPEPRSLCAALLLCLGMCRRSAGLGLFSQYRRIA